MAFVQKSAEDEFVKTFYITKEEVAEVKGAKGNEEKLQGIMSQLYGKVGYHLPENIAKGGETTIDKSGDGKFIYSGDNFFLNFSLFSFAFGFGLILLLNSKAKLLF